MRSLSSATATVFDTYINLYVFGHSGVSVVPGGREQAFVGGADVADCPSLTGVPGAEPAPKLVVTTATAIASTVSITASLMVL